MKPHFPRKYESMHEFKKIQKFNLSSLKFKIFKFHKLKTSFYVAQNFKTLLRC